MRNRNKAPKRAPPEPAKPSSGPQEQDWSTFEGESLGLLIESIQGKIKVARSLDGAALPEKIWLKQQFAIGVNEVTRVLERMPPSNDADDRPISSNNNLSYTRLQAILVASDCNPRWLTRHLPILASSRKVPLIFVKDKKRGSLRLGELVNLKTAIAIGIKAKGNAVNHIIQKILCDGCLNIERKSMGQSLLNGEINGNQQPGHAG
ncbi:Ribosomal_L7Ae domain-containing protein [Psidium guajava]|nr:Ribosomal_L7Ae domain-containing protein [Psidium guajava]